MEPQRHRDTERGAEPLPLELFNAKATRPEEPRRHKDTKKPADHADRRRCSFRCGSRRSTSSIGSSQPPTFYRRDAEAQRGICEASSCGEVLAAERRPGTAEPGNRSERKRSSRCPGSAACAFRAQASPLFFSIQWLGGARLLPKWKRREAEPTRFPSAGGDRPIAGSSAVSSGLCRSSSAMTSLRLCASASLRSSERAGNNSKL